MSILLDAFKLKPLQAMLFFRKKGYTFSWSWTEVWKHAHLHTFTVAKAMKADILQDIRSEVDKAISEGITFHQFKKELQPRLEKAGWWGTVETPGRASPTGEPEKVQLGSVRRLRTIYQTNLQTSYMAGRYKQQIESGMPYLQYIAIIDGQTTDRCRGLHLKVFRADDPIWDYLYPPNHWGCRSRVRSLTESKLERDNLTVASSEGRLARRIKTVNGQPVEVTGYEMDNGGIFLPDPGWDYNPGQTDYKPDLKGYGRDIRDQLKNDLPNDN